MRRLREVGVQTVSAQAAIPERQGASRDSAMLPYALVSGREGRCHSRHTMKTTNMMWNAAL